MIKHQTAFFGRIRLGFIASLRQMGRNIDHDRKICAEFRSSAVNDERVGATVVETTVEVAATGVKAVVGSSDRNETDERD